MTVTIAEAADPAPCIALRHAVFVVEQGFAAEGEVDAHDATAVHLLATEAGVPVGTARLLVDGAVGKIGRVCVLPSHRGTGLGAALIREGIARLAARGGIETVKLGAQCRALGFYEKLGFAVSGPVYDDEGVPHREMALAL
ncbi:GNAT family N-acetyltransferase [Acidimangrovimonas sediminis]|uniref:GNAT family N-acetyltransferase n=1 Tax=Acidimangrovimonas sediminis TaxID=2056283 RepID=UPI000C805DDA|nr:GNAT family N-acetyltransferase [Acidimangrovimonas sediminis]